MSYDPTVGRWTAQDPIAFDAGDPNLYRYVGNRPVDHVDPLGLYAYTYDDASEEYEKHVARRMNGQYNVELPYNDQGRKQQVDVRTADALAEAKRLSEESYKEWPRDEKGRPTRLPDDLKEQLERYIEAAKRDKQKNGKPRQVYFATPVPVPEEYRKMLEDMGVKPITIPEPPARK